MPKNHKGLIGVLEAQAILEAHAASFLRSASDCQKIAVGEEEGCVLAADVIAPEDYPFFDSSAMDGFAIRSEDFPYGLSASLPIIGEASAGSFRQNLSTASAMRIFTGAPVPFQADAVVPVECCTISENRLSISGVVVPQQHIRYQGENLRKGSILLHRGSVLSIANCAAAASVGICEFWIYRPLRVAIGITGNELLSLEQQRQEGQIYDSNGFLLQRLCKKMGYELGLLSYLPDRLEETERFLEQAADCCDIVLTSGGISMGDKDMLAKLTKAEGGGVSIQTHFSKVALKPGKPLTFAEIKQDDKSVPVFCLPGNPLSAFVTFLYFVAPYLRQIAGNQDKKSVPIQYVVEAPQHFKPHERTQFLFSVYTEKHTGLVPQGQRNLEVAILPDQSSGNIANMAAANSMLIVPAQTEVTKGSLLYLFPF